MASKRRSKPATSGREIVRAYDDAIQRERRAGHDLSPKTFLDIIAPSKRGRSEASSRRYLNKLRSGERSGSRLFARAAQDGGRRINVSFQDPDTGVVTSANMTIPYGSSRLDLFRPSIKNRRRSKIRVAAESYLRAKKGYEKIDIQRATILGVRSVKHTPKGLEKVR